MKISIVTLGVRGDVRPYVGLAAELQSAGYSVTLYGSPDFAGFARSCGVRYESGDINYTAATDTPEIRSIIEGDMVALAKNWQRTVAPLMSDALHLAERAGEDADLLIYDAKVVGAPDVAQARGIPAICVGIYPVTTPTARFPAPSFPLFQTFFARNMCGAVNRLSYLAQRAQRVMFLNQIQEWRRTALGMEPGPRFPTFAQNCTGSYPRLHLVSRHIVPEPEDWDSGVKNTGFIYVDAPGPAPNDAFETFMKAGETPIYVTFGSLSLNDRKTYTDMVFEGIERAGVRAVIEKGSGGLVYDELPSNIYSLSDIPHHAFLHRVQAMVHHGGCGTVAAGLRAGKPAFITPFSFAQPWWAARLKDLGLGPAPTPAKKLSAQNLAERIDEIATRKSYHARAGEISEKIAAENGARQAVQAIEQFARPH